MTGLPEIGPPTRPSNLRSPTPSSSSRCPSRVESRGGRGAAERGRGRGQRPPVCEVRVATRPCHWVPGA
jgi:hypothetical protein